MVQKHRRPAPRARVVPGRTIGKFVCEQTSCEQTSCEQKRRVRGAPAGTRRDETPVGVLPRPRLRHRPAPARAGSLHSSVVAANREDRRAATWAAAVALSVRACPAIGPGWVHVAPRGGGVSRRFVCFLTKRTCLPRAPRPTGRQLTTYGLL